MNNAYYVFYDIHPPPPAFLLFPYKYYPIHIQLFSNIIIQCGVHTY